MTIELKRDWEFIDGSKFQRERLVKVLIPAGRHEVECILNPWPTSEDQDYLVLVGTKIGLSLQYLKTFSDVSNGIHQVVIE